MSGKCASPRWYRCSALQSRASPHSAASVLFAQPKRSLDRCVRSTLRHLHVQPALLHAGCFGSPSRRRWMPRHCQEPKTIGQYSILAICTAERCRRDDFWLGPWEWVIQWLCLSASTNFHVKAACTSRSGTCVVPWRADTDCSSISLNWTSTVMLFRHLTPVAYHSQPWGGLFGQHNIGSLRR